VRKTTLQTPRSVQKEEEEVLQVPEEIPLQSNGEDHGAAGCPLQPVEVQAGADLHLQSGEDPTLEQVDA